jgi:hypothetical protein
MTNQTLRVSDEYLSHTKCENIGLLDRLLRMGAAVVLIGQILLWHEDPVAQYGLVLLGLYPAFTAIMGWDPLYAAAGWRTCGRSPRNVCGSLTDQLRAAAQIWPRDALVKVLPLRNAQSGVVGTRAEAANDATRQDRAS